MKLGKEADEIAAEEEQEIGAVQDTGWTTVTNRKNRFSKFRAEIGWIERETQKEIFSI